MSALPFSQRSATTAPTGLWRGRVTKVSGSHLYVTIPRLRQGYEFGPCEVLEGLGTPGWDTVLAGDPTHSHALDVAPWAVEDRVLVTFLEGRTEGLVVLGRFQ